MDSTNASRNPARSSTFLQGYNYIDQSDDLHMMESAGISTLGGMAMQQGLRTGDFVLLADALHKLELCKNLRKQKNGQPIDMSMDAVENRKIQIEREASRLATLRLNSLRGDALRTVKNYAAYKVGKGSLSVERAKTVIAIVSKALDDPRVVFRICGIAKLKLSREIAMDTKCPRLMCLYLGYRSQYKSDVGAIRQANGYRFVPDARQKAAFIYEHIYDPMFGKSVYWFHFKSVSVKLYRAAATQLNDSAEASGLENTGREINP